MNELPPKRRSPETAPVQPITISIKTQELSKSIVQGITEIGADPTTKMEALAESLDQDLQKSGIELKPEEKKIWQEKTVQLANPSQEQPIKNDNDKLFEVNLSEYQKTFDTLSKVYGLDQHKVKFGLLESLLVSNKVVDSLAGLSASAVFLSLLSDKGNFVKTGELIGRVITSKMVPGAREQHPDLGYIPLGMRPEHVVAASVELLDIAKRFKWPIALMLAYIPSAIGETIARVRLVDAMKTMRTAINERSANSLLMRDMEFTYDKSAAEINNILEKGKQSTLTFFSTSMTEVIPRLGAIGLASLGQIPMNPVGGALQLARLPFLYGVSKNYAQDVLQKRAEDLQRKDMIDTRINATLGSLEVVKTSESMETAIDQLKDNMEKRDTFQMSNLKQEVKQEKKMEVYNMAFNYGIPIVAGGIDLLLKRKKGVAAKSSIVSFLGGRIIEKNSKDLIDIYIDKIRPALQDIKRMEDLLGPYESLDKPDGLKEQQRVSVDSLSNFDISIKNLQYKNILYDASLDVPQGSFVTIKGPSGSGKTTFMRHMLGLFREGEGSVTYGGVEMQNIKKFGNESIYSAIGYSNQNPQYIENMTLKENLLLWSKREVSDEKITQVLQDLRLDQIIPRLDSTVKHFSGGELRRIGIARALLKDPKVLYLDEPTANLDQESAKQVLEIIKEMRRKRSDMTVVAVTHDPEFEKIAEKIVDFRDINKPKDGEDLGSRQVFYAAAKAN